MAAGSLFAKKEVIGLLFNFRSAARAEVTPNRSLTGHCTYYYRGE